MKFSDFPYERPDMDQLKSEYSARTEQLQTAEDYSTVRKAVLEIDSLEKKVYTLGALSYIRHSLDTRDEFYENEQKFWNKAIPELHEFTQKFNMAMMESPFRPELEKEFGSIIFKNLELNIRSFSPEIISYMQQENDLMMEYSKLIANAKVEFEGNTYPIPQMLPFRTDPDDARRLAAWKAEGSWYKANQGELDRIYDELVHLRDAMGKALGHEDYTELGYDKMGRNCYRKADVEKFRKAVIKYVVPVACSICRKQAERLGMQYPLSFADKALEFRDGNPRPVGNEQQILMNGQEFYDALSPETGRFFRMMRENGLLDVTSREGKENGGYCEGLPLYGVPFIFANFNGTQGDVEVVTHEAGHAFAYYVNRDRVPVSTIWPGMGSCEVHSMSMEVFSWPWARKFFGKDTEKYLYSHLASALTFIPYGTMVDHFQHIVYEKPEMTPGERHGVWKELLGVYMPWLRLDGGIPFYSEGEGWQRQHHIYTNPFYYIDYCLAQTVSLEFWAMIQKDVKEAWKKYMAYTEQGGSDVFTTLLEKAGLQSPFEEDCLKNVCEEAALWLEKNAL